MKSFSGNRTVTLIIAILTILLIVILVCDRSAPIKSVDLYITEVCAKNDTCAYDDNGDYGADYIEIYNNSDKDISLKGYGLSDDRWRIFKYTFGDVVIPSKKAIIVWCSEGEDESLYDKSYIAMDVHQTEFSLSDNESVLLCNDQREIVDSAFVSHTPDGKVLSSFKKDFNTYYVSDSSPYYVENELVIEDPATLDDPVFSIDSGWYKDPIHVKLTGSYENIYYTLDGSEPNENSLKYTGDIYIKDRSSDPNIYANIDNISPTNDYLPDYYVDKATVVKAIGFNGNEHSEIVSKTYFVGLDEKKDYDGISVMEISMDPEDLFGYDNGIYCMGRVYDTRLAKFGGTLKDDEDVYYYANYAKEDKGWERRAKIELFDENHNKQLEQNIGLRIHGGNSTAHNQKGFNLYAREEYDGSTAFKYDFFDKKYNKIMLRAGGYRDTYHTKIRDVLNQRLVSDRAVGIQRAIPCAVFLNGEYWGLYNLQETIGDSYVTENYGVVADNTMIMKNHDVSIEGPNKYIYYNMKGFAENHDLSITENYQQICEMMDVQSYIDHIAFQIYVANVDSIANNHARWRSIDDDGSLYGDCRWRWMLYDTDDSAGMIDGKSEYHIDSFIGGRWKNDLLGERKDAIFAALMENEEFKQRFTISFMDMANHNFNYERVSFILSEMASEYKYGVIASQKRFRGNFRNHRYLRDTYEGEFTEEYYDREIGVIDDFYKNRYRYITKYLKDDLSLEGDLYEIKIHTNASDNCTISINTISEVEDGWSGKYYSDYPVTVSCQPNEGYRFVGWSIGDKIISDSEVLEYELNSDTVVTAVVAAK